MELRRVLFRSEQRGQGAGRRLYKDVEQAAKAAQIKQLQISVRDTCPECLAFAKRRGFIERGHQIGLELNLETFDDQPYNTIIDKLQGVGFLFTSMEELGNTEEAQQKLYH